MSKEIHPDAINSLLNADHGDPFSLLGAHNVDDKQVSIRAIRPSAKQLFVVVDEKRMEMNRLHDAGFFELTVDGQRETINYRYGAITHDDKTETFIDPYIFPALFGETDLYLWNEGRYLYSYEKMGAHFREVNGILGVHFAVWCPNAYRVSVIGDFNDWDARVHPMREHVGSGVWELFIPGVQEWASYKFDIRSRVGGYHAEKADPFGFFSELRPKTASVVVNLGGYEWRDEAWIQSRNEGSPLNKPMSIYEVHVGSWQRRAGNRFLTYREMAHDLVEYVRDMGYTHIELMPIAEHPFDGSWGYQVTGYYAPTSRYGTPKDFMYFVDTCHQNGIGVILDWVPAHFPKDGFALSYFDGTHLYEHADMRQGEHPDWGTYIFNYGRNEVRNFLISNALFWLKEYHIDGLRVDAVSSMLYLDFGRKDGEWIPNKYGSNENLEAISFLQEANAIIHAEVPGAVTIAEESTAWGRVSRPTYLGGLGFTFKWNMGWMHDVLDYMQKDPIYRRYHHHQLTFSIMYAYSENFVLSLSHDEVVHLKGSLMTKMAGDWWQKFASVRLLFGYQYSHPGKKLLFMGMEFGQWAEWMETRSLDWNLVEQFETHRQLQVWMRDLNRFYKTQPALYEQDYSGDGFRWIEANHADESIYSYIRYADDPSDFLVVVCNFTPAVRYHYRIGVPEMGFYQEVLNSDSSHYGGSNVGNNGGVYADNMGWHGFGYSLGVTVPPLGILILKMKHTQ